MILVLNMYINISNWWLKCGCVLDFVTSRLKLNCFNLSIYGILLSSQEARVSALRAAAKGLETADENQDEKEEEKGDDADENVDGKDEPEGEGMEGEEEEDGGAADDILEVKDAAGVD